jgi:hypothetical protein
MKKFLIVFLSFLFFSYPVFATDIVGEIVKEIVYDAAGNILGYKYIMETGEVWYQFYDEQIDTLIDASNTMLDKAKSLEDRVIMASDIGGNSGKWRQFKPDDEPSDFYVMKKVLHESAGWYWYETYYSVSNLKVSIDSFGYVNYTFDCDYGVKWLNGVTTDIPGGNKIVYQTYGDTIKNSGSQLKTNYYPTNYDHSKHSSMLRTGSYCGYGDPETGLMPEDDITNPDSGKYDPTFEPGVDFFNMKFKIDDSRILEALENLDVKLDAEGWFDYLLKNSVWQEEEEESELNDFINQAMINLGVIPDPNTHVSRVVTFSETEVEVEEVDDGLYSDTSILVYPISIIKQFFDAIDDVEVDGTMNFPSINVRGETLLKEQEFNFYQMIYDLGLADLHEMYYLVINASLTLGLIYYAKRKFAEFQEGKKGDVS